VEAAMSIEQYDQTALELCEECGWKAVIPGDGCLVCARQKAKPVAWMYDFLNSDNRDEVIRDWMTQDYADIKRENGFNVRPLYTAPRQEQYDQTALELCNECGWKAIIPGDGCLVCARQKPTLWYHPLSGRVRFEATPNWIPLYK
jgi:hypothetical protein